MTEAEKIQITRVMKKTVEENPYMSCLGIEFLTLSEEFAHARMKAKKELNNPYGVLHGGSLFSLADTVCGSAGCLCGNYVTTVSGTLNYLLAAQDTEYVYCEAVQVKQGKHIQVYNVNIKDDNGLLLDSGVFTFYVTDQKVVTD